MKSLKPKIYPGENVTDFCASILVAAERLESAGAFKPEHLGYITHIFEDTSESKFRMWATHKYKEVTEFIKKLCVCDMDVLSQVYLITYESFVQEATQEYRDLVDSKRWEPATSKENSQDQPGACQTGLVASALELSVGGEGACWTGLVPSTPELFVGGEGACQTGLVASMGCGGFSVCGSLAKG